VIRLAAADHWAIVQSGDHHHAQIETVEQRLCVHVVQLRPQEQEKAPLTDRGRNGAVTLA